MLAKDDAAHEFQVVNLERAGISRRNALARKIKRLPLFHRSIFVLSMRDESSGEQALTEKPRELS